MATTKRHHPGVSVQAHRGKWRVKWRVDGRAVYQGGFDTEDAADEYAEKVYLRTKLDGQAPVVVADDDDVLTLAKWWARWEPGRPWAQSSRNTHALHWKLYIKPVFGPVALDDITTADVQAWHRKLEKRGKSPGYIGGLHRTLSMALQGAVENGLLPTGNPARTAKLRKTTKVPKAALDVATTDALLAAFDARSPKLALYARFIAATGMRRAEAAGLTWDRLDLDKGTVLVDRQMDYAADTLPTWCEPKNRKIRTVLLTPSIVAALREHKAAQPVVAIGGRGLVFTQDDGSAWPVSSLTEGFGRVRKALDAEGVALPRRAGWHVLRHTVGSRLLEAGVPPVEVAEMMGHSVEELLATYAHVTDRAAADARLRAALGQ